MYSTSRAKGKQFRYNALLPQIHSRKTCIETFACRALLVMVIAFTPISRDLLYLPQTSIHDMDSITQTVFAILYHRDVHEIQSMLELCIWCELAALTGIHIWPLTLFITMTWARFNRFHISHWQWQHAVFSNSCCTCTGHCSECTSSKHLTYPSWTMIDLCLPISASCSRYLWPWTTRACSFVNQTLKLTQNSSQPESLHNWTSHTSRCAP